MLLQANANPGLVNNEGETPLDMTSPDEEDIIELLRNEIKKKGGAREGDKRGEGGNGTSIGRTKGLCAL